MSFQLEKIKNLSFHSDWISNILNLDSGDLISGSFNGEIIIYDKKNFQSN